MCYLKGWSMLWRLLRRLVLEFESRPLVSSIEIEASIRREGSHRGMLKLFDYIEFILLWL